jgi:uncharacterized tellurite resistance protein B-like protein
MERHDLFRNLVLMAACDGSLTESEIDLLADRARQWNIDDSAFAQMMEYALSPDCELQIPRQHESRVELLKEMLRMMAADGKLAPAERRIFATAAAVMEFSDEQLNQLIDETLAEAEKSDG